MSLRVKSLVWIVVLSALISIHWVSRFPTQEWPHFFVYLIAILLSSGLKGALPRSEGIVSVDFPFIFLGILELSPLQAAILAACSVLAQSLIRVAKGFSPVQVLFNVGNVITATTLAWLTFSVARVVIAHQNAPALALCATVYFLANTVPVALVIAWDSGTSAFSNWRRNFLWYLPFYLVSAMLAAAANLIETMSGWMTALLLIPVVYTVYRAHRAQMDLIRDRERHVIEMEDLQLRTIEGLAMAIEAKDENTHSHLMRVRVYVLELGKIMGLDVLTMKALQTAAFLHDIGKLAIPEHIINKPGKLTHEEFEKMKIHPVVGADILRRVKFPYPVVPIVRGHHEAWDGTGYPDGLKGEEIPIAARILAAVDCLDALASDRPYRKAVPIVEAMAVIKSNSGTRFDPEVVRLLEENIERLEALAIQSIEDVEPLKTDLVIERGAAPGNGFEPEGPENDSSEQRPEGFADCESLILIAAANQEAKALYELSQALGSSLSARETSSMFARRLQSLIPFDCFAVYLMSDGSLLPQFMEGSSARTFSKHHVPLGEGISGWVAKSGRPIMNGNPTVEPNYIAQSRAFSADSSALSIPLFDSNDAVFGVLTVYSHQHANFTKDHLRILQAVQPKFTRSLENALRYRSAENDARVDHLTQLWNMRHFFEAIDAQIEKAQSTSERFALVVCDLNSFKSVNDQYGHPAGNELLRNVALALRESCRASDTIARLGGDEFAFLFPTMDEQSSESRLATLQEAIGQTSRELQIEIEISSSMGVAFYPQDGETAEELLGVADRGMYLRKREFYGLHHQTADPIVPETVTVR